MIFLNCDLLELEIRNSYKKRYCNYVCFRFLQGRQHLGRSGEGACPSPPLPHTHTLFLAYQKEKNETKKKERFSKQKLWKGCHKGQNVTVLATLERLEFNHGGLQYFSALHGPSTLKSISPALSYEYVFEYCSS